MDKSLMPNVFTSHHHWYTSTVDSLSSNGPKSSTSPRILYAYDNALHGFSALLSPNEFLMLENHPAFVTSYEETKGKLDTTRTIDFLSLNPNMGLWPASKYGQDVIVGVIDTGVWPESLSFRDNGMTPVPVRWKGTCQFGQSSFNGSLCNRKLIGARYFNKGVKAANPKMKLMTELESARDTDGHGTHTSSTVAGNYVDDVSFFGYAQGTARGVAPRARLAVYKAVWDDGISYSSDILAAMDQAISDGVDVISMSLGFDDLPLYKDPVAIGSFAAMEKGILVSTSAGNAGPTIGTLHNGIPWTLTVAASTVDRHFAGTLSLGNGHTVTGWSLFPAGANIQKVPLRYNKMLSSCNSSTEITKSAAYEIVICDDTGATRDQMVRVADSKAAAAIFISDDPFYYEVAEITWPGIVIGSKDGPGIIQYAKKRNNNPWASMEFQKTFVGSRPAPEAAFYTSRGPSPSYPGLLKPDIMAPGSQILAAYVPTVEAARIGNYISLSSDYALLSGTSMACPHASGVAGLLKGVHPDWSPAAIRSAMMTTANPLDNTDALIRANGYKPKPKLGPATPLAMGAGQVDPNRAMDPGLIYDVAPHDYIDLLCSMNLTKKQILTLVRSNKRDCTTSSSTDLNYPSFIALYDNKTTMGGIRTFRRMVTNVGVGGTTYEATVTSPKGCKVRVKPQRLVFNRKNDKQSFGLRVKYTRDSKEKVLFGSLVWKEVNGGHSVRSPIVVSPSLGSNFAAIVF